MLNSYSHSSDSDEKILCIAMIAQTGSVLNRIMACPAFFEGFIPEQEESIVLFLGLSTEGTSWLLKLKLKQPDFPAAFVSSDVHFLVNNLLKIKDADAFSECLKRFSPANEAFEVLLFTSIKKTSDQLAAFSFNHIEEGNTDLHIEVIDSQANTVSSGLKVLNELQRESIKIFSKLHFSEIERECNLKLKSPSFESAFSNYLFRTKNNLGYIDFAQTIQDARITDELLVMLKKKALEPSRALQWLPDPLEPSEIKAMGIKSFLKEPLLSSDSGLNSMDSKKGFKL